MASTPTVLIVHGAWHTPACMDTFRQSLQDRGLDSVCPQLPTMGDRKQSKDFLKKTFQDDVNIVKEHVAKLVDDGKEVVVAAHSYGGQVASEAVRLEYGKAERSRQGKTGGVVGLVFICAFLIPEGKLGQLYFLLPRFPFPFWLRPHPLGGYATVRRGARVFYHDLPEQEARDWEARLVCASSKHVQATTHAAQRHHRTLYVRCGRDRAIVPALQDYFIRKNREVGITVEEVAELDSGHSPFLSVPAELAGLVAKFAEARPGSKAGPEAGAETAPAA